MIRSAAVVLICIWIAAAFANPTQVGVWLATAVKSYHAEMVRGR